MTMTATTTAPAPITITVALSVVKNELTENVTYSSDDPRQRKVGLLPRIRAEKRNRTKTFIVPHGDHSEHLDHPSWITYKGDTVVWTCDRPFMLYVDYDLAVCDNLIDAPRNPFGASFVGVQAAREVAPGRFEVRGTTVLDESVHQMFYKYTAWVAGLEPLDPDGICTTGP